MLDRNGTVAKIVMNVLMMERNDEASVFRRSVRTCVPPRESRWHLDCVRVHLRRVATRPSEGREGPSEADHSPSSHSAGHAFTTWNVHNLETAVHCAKNVT